MRSISAGLEKSHILARLPDPTRIIGKIIRRYIQTQVLRWKLLGKGTFCDVSQSLGYHFFYFYLLLYKSVPCSQQRYIFSFLARLIKRRLSTPRFSISKSGRTLVCRVLLFGHHLRSRSDANSTKCRRGKKKNWVWSSVSTDVKVFLEVSTFPKSHLG